MVSDSQDSSKDGKARRASDPPGWVKILILAFVAFAIIGLFVVDHGSGGHTRDVTRSGHPGIWPLTVDSGTLGCDNGKIFVKVADTRYGLNGTALADHGYSDLAPIWANDPNASGLKMSIAGLISEGQALC